MPQFDLTRKMNDPCNDVSSGCLAFYGCWIDGRPDSVFSFNEATEHQDWVILKAKGIDFVLKIRQPQSVKIYPDRLDVLYAQEILCSNIENNYRGSHKPLVWQRFQAINGKVLYTTNANSFERIYKHTFKIYDSFPALTLLQRGEGEAWEKLYSCYPQKSLPSNG